MEATGLRNFLCNREAEGIHRCDVNHKTVAIIFTDVATPFVDYTPPTSTLIFSQETDETQCIDIAILDDQVFEGTEIISLTVVVQNSNSVSNAQITILDDDGNLACNE